MPQITINVNSINYTVGYDGTFYSPQGMLVALNNLGFGIFYIATDGATNYLTTIDDDDVFGDITTSPDPILLTTNTDCLGTGFDGEGSIIASAFVGGDGIYEWIAIGTSTGDAVANVNGLDRESIVGQSSYQFTNLANGTYYVALKDNIGNIGISVGTNVGCTPIPISTTTTTTTTLAPITWTSTPSCAGDGLAGSGVITLSSISGGSGTYLYAGIGTTEEEAATDVLNPATRTNITGLTVQFTSLANGIYYTAIQDNVGGLHFSAQINVSCNNTTTTTTTAAPTTSTTTTTTTLAPTTSTTTTTTTGVGPTTTSTTTTTTTLFAQTVTYASTQVDACLNPTGSQNVTGNATTFCNCTVFNSAGFITVPSGNYVLAYNGDTLNVSIAGAPSTTATVIGGGGCGVCPLSTTTTTTTTTLQQVWYQMSNCNGGGTVYSQVNDDGYAAVGDRVFGVVLGVPSTLVVTNVLFSEPVGATLVAIINSGQTGCPSTSTTTTTTSLAVVSLSTTASCVGGGFNGNGRIVADSFAGGSGVYQYAGIGTSEANAISDVVNPATRVTITGSSVTFNSLVNDNYWIAIRDSLGNIGLSAQTAVSCNATTTTSTTTTSTTLPPFTANIATTDAFDACNAPELSNIVFYGNGLNACDSTSAVMDATLAAYLGDSQPFYINDRVDGIFYSSEWVRIGTTTSCSRISSCIACVDAVTLSLTPSCVGGEGSGTILANGFSGGTGSFEYISISATSQADALARLDNPATRTFINGATEYTFTSLPNSTYYVAIMDFSGYKGANSTSVNCVNTTTTSTTTTTTTLQGIQFGVSLNTKYGNDFLACAGTVTGVVYQKAEVGSTPTVGAQLYTSSTTGAGTEWTPSQGIGLYLMQFGGSTKWSVLVGVTGLINQVTSCAGVSTTTTTTTLPPISVTATPSCDGIGLSGQGRVTANFSGGTGSYTFAALGTSEANAIACVNNPSCPERVSVVGTSYAWTSLANGPYYVAVLDSNASLGYSGLATVSCNATTSTTTTTTTLQGIEFGVSLNTKYGNDFLACAGTVTGVVYQKAEVGSTPTVGAQLYTSSTTGAGTEWTPSQGIGLYLMQFGGSTKWAVLVGTTGLINQVTSCAGVSTTTTTTTLPPISVTATPSCDGGGFSGQGRITASGFSGGTGSYTFAALGTSQANAISCVNNPSCPERVNIVGLSSYAWTSLANSNYAVAILDTAGGLGYSSLVTVSCNATTTSTTTTTSTLAGVQFGVSISTNYPTDFLACAGTVTGVIYQKAEFGNTPTVGAQLYTSSTTGSGTEWTPSAGTGLYLMQFGGSTKWAVLVGTTGLINSVTSCSGVTTTSTTTTTTTVPPDCECYTIYNEGGTTGNYSYQRCPDGVVVSPNIVAGTNQIRCVLAGTTITINSGLLTDVQCGTPCNVQGDCTPC
jgi:hypothetical protein